MPLPDVTAVVELVYRPTPLHTSASSWPSTTPTPPTPY